MMDGKSGDDDDDDDDEDKLACVEWGDSEIDRWRKR